jgi:hypothetical protein
MGPRSIFKGFTWSGIAVALVATGALGLSACSGGASTPKASAAPTAAASTSAKGLTLAVAGSSTYRPQFPSVAASKVSYPEQSAWSSFLVGSSVAAYPPSTFLTKYAPQGVSVKNFDPKMSQSQANKLGQALINTLAWTGWADANDAPAALTTLYGSGFDEAGSETYQDLQSGHRVIFENGNGAYPLTISLVVLGSQLQSEVPTTDTLGLIISRSTKPYAVSVVAPGGTSQSVTVPSNQQNGHLVEIGTLATSLAFGMYLHMDTAVYGCGSTTGAAICSLAGISAR